MFLQTSPIVDVQLGSKYTSAYKKLIKTRAWSFDDYILKFVLKFFQDCNLDNTFLVNNLYEITF